MQKPLDIRGYMCSRFDCPKGSLAVAGDDNTRDHNETPVGLHIRQAELLLLKQLLDKALIQMEAHT